MNLRGWVHVKLSQVSLLSYLFFELRKFIIHNLCVVIGYTEQCSIKINKRASTIYPAHNHHTQQHWVERQKKNFKASRDLSPNIQQQEFEGRIYTNFSLSLSLSVHSLPLFFFFRYWELCGYVRWLRLPHVERERDCPVLTGPMQQQQQQKLPATFLSRVTLKSHSDRCGRAFFFSLAVGIACR